MQLSNCDVTKRYRLIWFLGQDGGERFRLSGQWGAVDRRDAFDSDSVSRTIFYGHFV